jgi:integrase
LREYAAPLRRLPVDKITTDDVLSVLKPLWNEKPETASRLRGRIERVLDAAKAQGLRAGENPARWRGHLDQLLPKRQRLTRGHHAAMSYAEMPAFMDDLRARQSTAARALEFAILTAARSGEVLGLRWEEIDLDRAVWTVPANRMKAGREHRVPLSRPALKLLKAMHEGCDGKFVFPGQKPGKPLSVMALEMVLRRMKVEAVTVHGFRSAFRDWAAERTNFSNEVCEAALAHVIENKAEAAYRRGDLFDKRRKLMDAWATHCALPPAKSSHLADKSARFSLYPKLPRREPVAPVVDNRHRRPACPAPFTSGVGWLWSWLRNVTGGAMQARSRLQLSRHHRPDSWVL